MRSQFLKLAVTGALAIAATTNAPHAGSDIDSRRSFPVDFGGDRARLELSGSLTDPSEGFEARLYRLAGEADTGRRPAPDAVWSVRPDGALTVVVIRIGPDRLEALLPAHDSPPHETTADGICGPYDDFPTPVWVEVNGVPVDVPDSIADLQQARAAVAHARDRAPLTEPAAFFDGFAMLHSAILTTLGPSTSNIETLAKDRCSAPCLGCAAGILRVAGMAGATTLACTSAVTSAGATLGGCVLAMVFAHATVVEAGLRCGACDACRNQGRGGHDAPCECPCRGEPLCDCGPGCPPEEDEDDLPLP